MIAVKSIIENLKWILIFFTFSNILLNLYSDSFTNIQYLVVEFIVLFLLLGFNNRLVYDTDKHKLSACITLKLFNIALYKLKKFAIEKDRIEDITYKFSNKLTTINIHYVSDDNVPSSYSFICFLQTKTVQTLIKSIISSKPHVQPEKGTKHQEKSEHFLTMDTFMGIFRHQGLFSEATAKNKFNIAPFCMPIPEAKKNIVKAIVLLFALFTIVLSYTSQNIKVLGVLSVVTYLSYWGARAFICNKHYFVNTSPLSAVKVSADKLYLPALLFNKQKPLAVTKEDLLSINAKWNHNHTSMSNQIANTTAKAYVVSIVFDTKERGSSVPTNNFSIDGEALLFSLLKYGYPIKLNKTNDAVYPIKKYIFIMLGLFISFMTISYIIK